MSEIRWKTKIKTAIRICQESLREPIIIITHPKIFREMILEGLEDGYNMWGFCENSTVFGMKIVVSPLVKDFQLVSNRSWVDQKW